MNVIRGGKAYRINLEMKILGFPSPWGVASLTMDACEQVLASVIITLPPEFNITRSTTNEVTYIRHRDHVKTRAEVAKTS